MPAGDDVAAGRAGAGVGCADGWTRPLIVGASGQVGAALQSSLEHDPASPQGGLQVLSSARRAEAGRIAPDLLLDLSALRTPDEAARFLDPLGPDLLLCPGAMTFVDGCEGDARLAFQVNAHGPSALASYAYSRGIPFVFFSSDYVFSGSEETPGPYAETDVPAPCNVYGASKYQGELAVLRVHPAALVIRTSWVYGPDPAGKNFVAALRRQLLAGQTVRVPADQVSTPTLNADLAAMTLALLRAGASGVVHITGPELMSRYELAVAVARFWGLKERLIKGVTTASLGQRAPRPLRSGLRSARIGGWTSLPRMRVLDEGLRVTQAHAPQSSPVEG